MRRINISVSYWKLYKLFVLGLCFLKIFFTQWWPLLNSFKFNTSMEEFQISYVVYELSIWTQLHEIIFIHDCLDCFPSSCNLTDVLSMSFCLTFPTRAWMGRLFFFIFWHIFERGWSLNSKPINVSGHTSINFNWPWMTKEAPNSYFGISTSIFRMRTF